MLPATRSVLIVLATFVAIVFHVPLAAWAQATPPPEETVPTTVQEELARLNRTMSRIVELLEREAEDRRLGLVLERVELESDRVADLEAELRRLESAKRSLENERFQIQSHLESLADQLEEAALETPREALRSLESAASGAERMLERLADQISEVEGRLAQTETELSSRRRDLQALRDRVDRALQGD
jgi:chromosome segregation ATPase